MRLVDYDVEQHRDYARGRALDPRQEKVWLDAFAAALETAGPGMAAPETATPRTVPPETAGPGMAGLDVGSGTGRFTPALARAFGPVIGIEPSVRMREQAPAHPGVRYLAGSAERIPVPGASADYALMFLSWHHVRDKPRAARELTRVIRPGGRLLLRANFSDHHPRPWWLAHFPDGYATDAAIFQPLAEVIATFTALGWRVASFGTVTEPSPGTRQDMLERLRLRTFSFFARMSAEQIETGLRELARVVAEDPGAPSPTFAEPLLTLRRSAND